ncbi:MAG TPA: DUF3465 domain-containing protein [Bdellovibrio sp.]
MKKSFLFSAIVLLFSSLSFAGPLPTCMDKQKNLDFNEAQVIDWIYSSKKKFMSRAFVRGILVNVLEDRQNHTHFEVDLDHDLRTTHDRIEIVYNVKFGPLPKYEFGDEVIACGDYITDPYSPVGAIIHWVHFAPKKTHDHGFLIIGGKLLGQKILPQDIR